MSGISKKLMGTTAAGGGPLAIEDVFSTYLYTGNSSTQTITNGIDLAGEGGLVWGKPRSASDGHWLVDSERGVGSNGNYKYLRSDTASIELDLPSRSVSTFNSDGFTLQSSSDTQFNESGVTYASWTFRKAPRFFDCVEYTGTGGARTVDHNLGTTVGSLIIKKTDTSENWYVYHRGVNFGATQFPLLVLNTTAAASANKELINSTEPTDAVFSVASDLNTSGGTYVAYLFAHDPLGPSEDGSDGLIACGSYTGDGTTDGSNVVDVGFEPQWLMVKASSTTGNWYLLDTMRGLTAVGAVGDRDLAANSSGAEGNPSGKFYVTQNGFAAAANVGPVNQSGQTYIYIAIRRGPMRAPESGTEVFATDYSASPASQATSPPTQFYSGWPVDWSLSRYKNSTENWSAYTRHTGSKFLKTNLTDAEADSFVNRFDTNTGDRVLTTSADTQFRGWMFRRAPGFFDVVAYSGNSVAGRTVPHNLGVAPEMMIVKRRSAAENWAVHHKDLGATNVILLQSSGAAYDDSAFNDTLPTDSVFSTSAATETNASGSTYIAYLFATLPGVSKVGSFSITESGGDVTVDCGFTSGARFILLKSANTTSNWYVFDTERGIVSGTFPSGTDPYLTLNKTDAENNSFDAISPTSSGFIARVGNDQLVPGLIPDNSTVIYLAIA